MLMLELVIEVIILLDLLEFKVIEGANSAANSGAITLLSLFLLALSSTKKGTQQLSSLTAVVKWQGEAYGENLGLHSDTRPSTPEG